MPLSIFYPIIYVLVTIWSLFAWKRTKEKGWFWFVLIGIIATFLSLFSFSVDNLFNTTPRFKFYVNSIFLVTNPLIFIGVVFTLWKGFKKS